MMKIIKDGIKIIVIVIVLLGIIYFIDKNFGKFGEPITGVITGLLMIGLNYLNFNIMSNEQSNKLNFRSFFEIIILCIVLVLKFFSKEIDTNLYLFFTTVIMTRGIGLFIFKCALVDQYFMILKSQKDGEIPEIDVGWKVISGYLCKKLTFFKKK